MLDSPTIKRRKGNEIDDGFERLRSEAIELVQQISGRVWTDYNLHDPGITILEQLIYAITDLSYRCDFAIEDYLARHESAVDLEAQSLHDPREIYSCRATTAADYRKLLLDAVPELDDVRLDQMSPADGILGLYRIVVKLSRDPSARKRDEIVEAVRRHYHRARNLCEDIGEVLVVENIEYELCARIEVGSGYNPADILGDIYFNCSRRIARAVPITNYDQVEARHGTLDQLFDGPMTEHGFFFDDTHQAGAEFAVSSLFSTVNAIDGVEQIEQLCLRRNGRDYYDRLDAPGPGQAFDLAVPAPGDEIQVELMTNGRKLKIPIDDVLARYREKRFKDYATRRKPQNKELLYQPIANVTRPLKRYFSIQNQFPASYGVNRFGVPESADRGTRARVRQLKGYLLIFEQFLLNFLANLDSVDRLFSKQTEPRRSYATQVVDAEQVGDLAAVYPERAAEAFEQISIQYDNFYARKSRALDYLLALYGERFSQNSLRHFNFYYAKDEIDAVIVANKVAFLEQIVELGRDRAAAIDYTDSSIRDACGLARRSALLLGFEQQASLVAALMEQNLRLCPHAEFERQLAERDALSLLAAQDIADGQYIQPAITPVAAELDIEGLARQLRGLAALGQGLLSDKMLRKGIDIGRYRVGRDNSHEPYRLCLKLDDNAFWHLGSYTYKSVAVQIANYLRRYLILLNRFSEGLHIVEHLLLRPSLVVEGEDDGTLYSFRVSVVLPAWSKRCRNPEFRNLVRETLRLNAPAQVYTEFYWLDFEQMVEFETLYREWLQLKADPAGDANELDRRARAILSFFAAAQSSQTEELWLPL